MYSPGKYVRAPEFSDESNEMNMFESEGETTRNTVSNNGNSGEQEADIEQHPSECFIRDDIDDVTEAHSLRSMNRSSNFGRKLEQFGNELDEIRHCLERVQPKFSEPYEQDDSWYQVTSRQLENVGNIRLDNIEVFPNDISPNKMWEEWRRFIEKFEITTLLSNVVDPTRKTLVLFIALGKKLSAMVKAAKLRPWIIPSVIQCS